MDWKFLIYSVVKIAFAIGVLHAIAAYAVLAERKISAWIQDRVGPNRVAPPFVKYIPVLGPALTRLGIFQPLADGLKFMLKEDFTPSGVHKAYFWLAPAVAIIPSILVIAVIPFGSVMGDQKMVIADLNVGILYTFGIVSLGVYGIVLAGYAANSKYPFFGGIRSSAQMISYEISMGMSVIPVFLIAGNLNLSTVIGWQAQHGWLVLYAPLSFFIFLVAGFAETNRLPFDLPEAETELVGGYHTEYSSMKFAMFFMAEYANMITVSCVATLLFFGGWTSPFGNLIPAFGGVLVQAILPVFWFVVKVFCFLFLYIWVRGTLPRLRYDQLMGFSWKFLMPLAIANILATSLWLANRTL